MVHKTESYAMKILQDSDLGLELLLERCHICGRRFEEDNTMSSDTHTENHNLILVLKRKRMMEPEGRYRVNMFGIRNRE